MILYWLQKILIGIIGLITAPLLALPDVSLPAGISAALTTAGGWIGILDMIVPISTFLAVFGTMLVIEGFIFVYKTIKWVYNKIPGVN